MALDRRGFLAALAVAPVWLAAQRLTPIRVATGVTPPSIHNIFLHVAYERGIFRDNGLDVTEFLQLRGGPLALQAIAADQVDVAPADPEGLLAAVLSGQRLRAVAAPGAHLSYMVAVRKEIRSVGDLAGKPFAISRPGAISQYLLFPLLDRAGVGRDAVQWVGVGGGYERLLALQADRVKGALLNVDFAMEAAADPNLRLVQSISDILPEYPVEMIVLRQDLIDAHPDTADAIVRAIIQACRFIVQHKPETIAIAKHYAPGMDAAVLGRAYDELLRIHGFGVNGGMTAGNVRIAHDLALQNRQIDRAVAADRWTDFRMQQRALARLGQFPERP